MKDTGAGIRKRDIEKLFKPFKTLKATRHLNANGIGIGLCVSQLICEQLGGDISCFSDGEGLGALFEFRL